MEQKSYLTKLLFFREKVGLISLIPDGGASIEMLSLRFTPLCHFLFHAYTSYARNAWNKKCHPPKGGQHFFAERVGFEPTVPLLVHELSKLARSATLTPLQFIRA